MTSPSFAYRRHPRANPGGGRAARRLAAGPLEECRASKPRRLGDLYGTYGTWNGPGSGVTSSRASRPYRSDARSTARIMSANTSGCL